MSLSPVEVKRAANLAEALVMLNDGTKARILAGGTDLIPRLKDGLALPGPVVDISSLQQELSYIRQQDGMICIGALTTHAAICDSKLAREYIPVLAQACRTVGSLQIRNRASIGGNIANASPAGDTLPALLALDAGLKLVSPGYTRQVQLEDFLIGPGKTLLADGEIISEIYIPAHSINSKGLFTKFGSRNALIISLASVAVLCDQAGKWRVAYGALSARPIRAYRLEKALNEQKVKVYDELKEIIAPIVEPISDIRASADYRRELAVNLTYISLKELEAI